MRSARVLVIGSSLPNRTVHHYGHGDQIEFVALEDWLREPRNAERAEMVVVEVAEIPPVKECRVLLSLAEMLPTARRVAVIRANYTSVLYELFVSGATHFVFGEVDEFLCRMLKETARNLEMD